MTFLDKYCERTAAELFNEPLNAITNLAFLLAAYLAWRRFRADSDLTFVQGWFQL